MVQMGTGNVIEQDDATSEYTPDHGFDLGKHLLMTDSNNLQ
jgi:hypothetical protein